MTADPTQLVLEKLNDTRRCGDGWIAFCPAHDDTRPSLHVSRGTDGRVLLYCHAGCSFHCICRAIGIPERACYLDNRRLNRSSKAEVVYEYADENGELLFEVVRRVTKSGKAFLQRRLDEAGAVVWGLGPGWYERRGRDWKRIKDAALDPANSPKPGARWFDDCRRVLYRLPDLIAADPGALVYIVEGEKDADNLIKHGLVATTNPSGAGKWMDDYSRHLRGRHVVILPDNDEAGRNHAEAVARSLDGVAASLKIVALPGLPDKGDVTDWLDSSGTVDGLARLVADTATFDRGRGDVPQESQDTQDSQSIYLSVDGNDRRIYRRELAEGVPSTLPLDCYILMAHDVNRDALTRGRADGNAERVTPLFEFLRVLKAHPALARVDAGTALTTVQAVMDCWPRPNGSSAWSHYFGMNDDDAGAEFYDAWDKVRAPVGVKVLQDVVRKAKQNCVRLSRNCPLLGYNLFLNVALRLQIHMGEGNIRICVRHIGEALGVSHMTVSRYCDTAQKEGVLKLVKEHHFTPGGKHNLCAEYQFVRSYFPTVMPDP